VGDWVVGVAVVRNAVGDKVGALVGTAVVGP